MPQNQGDFLRKPPASVEAEQAIISAIISNNRAYEKVSEFLKPEHFIEMAHQHIFTAIASLQEKGHLADSITIKNFMEQAGTFEAVGAEYLASLASSATSIVNAFDYGKLVYDLAQKRGLIELGTEIVNTAYQGEGDAQKQIESAEQNLYDLATTGDVDTKAESFGRAAQTALAIIEKAYKSDGHLTGVSTGLEAMDKKLGGLQPSDLLVLAARPGMGKTALALNVAFNVANEVLNKRTPDKLNGPVVFFSLEMSSDQLTSRVLSFTAEVSSHNMLTGKINENDFQKIAEHSRALSSLPLFIDDTPGISIGGIRTRARRLKRNEGGLSLIVVDYIQLIEAQSKRSSDSRVNEVSEITRGLKILAKELDVPVIALSQLSRQVESRDDKHPQLADLRESGSIEQDADIVMFIYREAYYENNKEPKDANSPEYISWKAKMDRIRNKAEVVIAKQRRGPTGSVDLSFIGEYTKFGNFYNG